MSKFAPTMGYQGLRKPHVFEYTIVADSEERGWVPTTQNAVRQHVSEDKVPQAPDYVEVVTDGIRRRFHRVR